MRTYRKYQFVKIIKDFIDKHAPLKKYSRRQKRLKEEHHEKYETRPYRLESIFKPEQRRRPAKKFGGARVTT